eukprot:830389-Amphidinium_carterae.1
MVLPSSASPSLLRHTVRTASTLHSWCAATTVLRPDSMVSLSRWWILFASVSKLGSSRSSSAAAPRTEGSSCSAARTTS